MLKEKTLLLTIFIIILISSVASASGLSIGQENYNFKFINVNLSSQSDVSLLSLGYGQDRFSGFAAELFSGDQANGIEVEYQFVPQSLQQKAEKFNYAAKLGVVSGDLWKEDASGLKAGFVIERPIEKKSEVYFDADIINASGIIVDAELGFCGELSEGIMGVLGYKMITHEDYQSIEGVHYGMKIDF